jgi:hypothetical protein
MGVFGIVACICFVVHGSASRLGHPHGEGTSSSLAESDQLSKLCQERIVYRVGNRGHIASIENGKCRNKSFDDMKALEKKLFENACEMIRKGEGTMTTVDAFSKVMATSSGSKYSMCLDCTQAEIERFCAITAPKSNSDRHHSLLLAVAYLEPFKSSLCNKSDPSSSLKSAFKALSRGYAKSHYDERVWKQIEEWNEELDEFWNRMTAAVKEKSVQNVQAVIDTFDNHEKEHAEILKYFKTDFYQPFGGQNKQSSINLLDIGCNAISKVCNVPMLEWSAPDDAREEIKGLSCAVADGKFSA